MSKLQPPARKPARTRKPKVAPPSDDLHDLPPVNRRIKNRPRKTKRNVVHRADAASDQLVGSDTELTDVPFYSQLLAGVSNGEDID